MKKTLKNLIYQSHLLDILNYEIKVCNIETFISYSESVFFSISQKEIFYACGLRTPEFTQIHNVLI